MTKSLRQKLIKSNDAIFRQLILHRDNYICQRTGKKNNLQVAHIFSRGHLTLRWEEDNAICLNAGIHLYWAHKEPDEFLEWCEKRLGKHRFKILQLKKRYKAPVRMDELKGWNIYLKQELSKIE